MAVCSEGDTVVWAAMRSIMDAVMQADTVLETGVYDPRSDPSSVWSRTSGVQATLALTFELQPDAQVVQSFLSPALGDFSAWDFTHAFMAPLEAAGELVFLAEADACWCSSMWRVVPSGAGHTLEALPPNLCGCCQSLQVPTAGDKLDYTQYWIPAGQLSQWVRAPGTSGRGAVHISELDKCRAMSGGVNIRRDAAVLQAAQREIRGYFTWLISSSRMDDIYNTMESICAASCGAKPSKVWKAQVESHQLCDMAQVSLRDVIYTMRLNSADGFTLPGCVTTSGCSVSKPWMQLTCGAQPCADSGLLPVYCNTLKNLEQMAEALPDLLQPAGYVNECGLSCAAMRTAQLVQCQREQHTVMGELPATYEDGDTLPDGVELLDADFAVDQCDDVICYADEEGNDAVAKKTKAYFRLFIVRLGKALQDGAYAAWQAQHASTPDRLHCRTYWRVYNLNLSPGFVAWTGEGQAKGVFQERLPVVGYPYFSGGHRSYCLPWAGINRLEGEDLGAVQEFSPIAGRVNSCGNTLEGFPDLIDALGSAILLGYQLVAADVELVNPHTSGDYATYNCDVTSGYAAPGTHVAYDSALQGFTGPEPVHWNKDWGGDAYFTVLEIVCFCPAQQNSLSGMHTGGYTDCTNMLFDTECS